MGRMWEFLVLVLLIGALVLLIGPRFMGRRGPGTDAAHGTLLVSGVSPRNIVSLAASALSFSTCFRVSLRSVCTEAQACSSRRRGVQLR